MLSDNNCTGWGEDLIMSVIVEPLRCIYETNIILYTNCTSIKKKMVLAFNRMFPVYGERLISIEWDNCGDIDMHATY